MITIIGMVPIIFLTVAILSVYETNAREQKLQEVKNYATIAKDILVDKSFDNDAISKMYTVSQVYDGRIVVVDSSLQIKCDTNVDIENAKSSESKYCVSDEIITSINNGKEYVIKKNDKYTEYITPIKGHDGKKIIGALVLTYSNEDDN